MVKREEERKRIGQRIAEIRKQQGMTQQELADKAGLQRTHILRLEQGVYGATIDVLSAIADALGHKMEFIKKVKI